MTVTYSLDVAQARFCGFTKLLTRWKGSIYKILWKEFFVFCAGYTAISVTYRCLLSGQQRECFEKVVLFVESLTDLIPLSFVLGFYVSLVVGRWWAQYDAIPWPDRLCLMIAAYVHGADERSRMIRRTLGRYLILLQALTFQAVSTSVKRRFPTTRHLVAVGIMTEDEQSVYEKVDFVYGKWWIPCQWFSSLLMRAKKEGRIKDSILLDGLFRELLNYRNSCGTMMSYDWISVPLVYTQVVTLATYMYALSLIIGRQYLDTSKNYDKHQVDLYVPFFTIMQFFFYVGWLKVAEQIVNPYGEDDDDFELNWCLDRTVHAVYLIVDHLQTKHPKIRKDFFWDELEPKLPQTKSSAKSTENPQLGSAFNLEVEEAHYLPMDTFLEQDREENVYSSDSLRQTNGLRSSFIMRAFHRTFGQSFQRKQSVQRKDAAKNNVAFFRGHSHPGLSSPTTPAESRKSSFRSYTKRTSPSHSRTSSISYRQNSAHLRRYNNSKSNQEAEKTQQRIGNWTDSDFQASHDNLQHGTTTPDIRQFVEMPTMAGSGDIDLDSSVPRLEIIMPSIPEEPWRVTSSARVQSEPQDTNSRITSLARVQSDPQDTNSRIMSPDRVQAEPQDTDSRIMSPDIVQADPQDTDDVQSLVKEASEVLRELNRAIGVQGHEKDCALKGYESCCSLASDESSDESNSRTDPCDVDATQPKSNDIALVMQSDSCGKAYAN